MKDYPSITTRIDFSKSYYLFDKLDGSNIRAEWSPKKGFYKFGSRTQLLIPDQADLYPSKDIIREQFENELSSRFSKAKFERAVCFFEYAGPNSFAGSHRDPVSDMTATLIDISVYKKGFMGPKKFLEFTEGLCRPALLYQGKLTEEIFQSVRTCTLPGITYEGVIGKGEDKDKNGHLMFKIKTNKWLDRLKEFCNNDEGLYNRLK